ncbi:MAG: FG-GAP repeat protein [Ignavibacteria bacterium]|nr:FG-GAP repeat protein [Ignavibacteria bacterium]
MNGDGYSDMIVGAILNDAGGSSAGRAYIYLNSMTGTDIADEFFTGAAVNDGLGYSVSSAGDVNGDGFADLIIGAPYNSAGGSNAGRVYIYFGVSFRIMLLI